MDKTVQQLIDELMHFNQLWMNHTNLQFGYFCAVPIRSNTDSGHNANRTHAFKFTTELNHMQLQYVHLITLLLLIKCTIIEHQYDIVCKVCSFVKLFSILSAQILRCLIIHLFHFYVYFEYFYYYLADDDMNNCFCFCVYSYYNQNFVFYFLVAAHLICMIQKLFYNEVYHYLFHHSTIV